MSETLPIVVGNVVVRGDFDRHLADIRRRRACLCGSANDVRYGPAIWGYGYVCRRCRKLWTERNGERWSGPSYKRKRPSRLGGEAGKEKPQ